MTSSATKETTKGSGETLPVGPSISSRLRQPLAAIQGFDSALYQPAPKSQAATAAARTAR